MYSSQDSLNERQILKKSTRPPSPCLLTAAHLSVCVLLDGDVSRSPGLATVCGDQTACSTIERNGIGVVWISGVHDERRVEVVMLRDGSAHRLLALHRCWERIVSTSTLNKKSLGDSTDLCPNLRRGRSL